MKLPAAPTTSPDGECARCRSAHLLEFHIGKEKEETKERQFRVPKGAFVAIAPDYNKIEPLADLTMEGLAFCFVISATENHQTNHI